MFCNHCHNSESWRWVLGVFLGLLALAGLHLAAHTADGGFYLHGLGLFAVCSAGIFHLIRRFFDARDDHH